MGWKDDLKNIVGGHGGHKSPQDLGDKRRTPDKEERQERQEQQQKQGETKWWWQE